MSNVRYSDKWWFLRLILEFIPDWRAVQFHDNGQAGSVGFVHSQRNYPHTYSATTRQT